MMAQVGLMRMEVVNSAVSSTSCCWTSGRLGGCIFEVDGSRKGARSHFRVLRKEISGVGFRHLRCQQRMSPSPSRALVARASADGEKQGGSDEQQFGLGGPGTWFGFGTKQERQVGRLAMVGFGAAITMEIVTGKGVLGQLGIDPYVAKFPLLAGFLFLLVAGLLGGYVVINNPPDTSKAPPNDGDGLPRDPLKTFDPRNLDPLTTWTRGGVVDRATGQKGREPYVSDLDLPAPPTEK